MLRSAGISSGAALSPLFLNIFILLLSPPVSACYRYSVDLPSVRPAVYVRNKITYVVHRMVVLLYRYVLPCTLVPLVLPELPYRVLSALMYLQLTLLQRCAYQLYPPAYVIVCLYCPESAVPADTLNKARG